ncbi:MAG: DUF4268 domain-containing protein [Ferruginibacter sp.]|nr:DUF4268 domain-containing protein [Chitinophagaceae bacterium]
MYSKQEIALIRKKFWTSFGQYMRPVIGAGGDTINWLNYKTGLRHVYFRMDAGNESVSIAIELRHPETTQQKHYFEQLQQLVLILEQSIGEKWNWQLHETDEDGHTVSRISKTEVGVNIFAEADWPAIISFLKPRIIALDHFWMQVKDGFV